MTRPAHYRASLALGFLLAATSAAAQAPGTPAEAIPITLAEYVRMSLAASPEVLQADARHLEARARWKSQLAAAWLPTLSFTGSAYPYGHNPADQYRFVHWRLNRDDMSFNTTVGLNLFNSFQDYERVRSARLAQEASGHSLEAQRREHAFAASRAYFELSLKERLQEVAGENLKAQEEQYRLTKDLYQNGMKSLSDLLKSETDWRSSELRMAAARAERLRALARFNSLIERDPDVSATLSPVPEPGPQESLPPLAEDVGRALKRRPEALRAQAQLERGDVGVKQARRELLPVFSVDATWNRQDTATFGQPVTTLSGIPRPNYQLGMRLTLPVGYNVISQAQNWTAANAERLRAQGEQTAVVRQVKLEAVQARISLEQALSGSRIATQKAALAGRNLEIVREQYRQGSADVIRLGQAQLDFLQARVERSQAAHDAVLSRLQYRLAVGENQW